MHKHTNRNYSQPRHSRLCKHAQRVMSGLRQQAICLSSITCKTPEPTLRDERLHSELILLSGDRDCPPRNDISHIYCSHNPVNVKFGRTQMSNSPCWTLTVDSSIKKPATDKKHNLPPSCLCVVMTWDNNVFLSFVFLFVCFFTRISSSFLTSSS